MSSKMSSRPRGLFTAGLALLELRHCASGGGASGVGASGVGASCDFVCQATPVNGFNNVGVSPQSELKFLLPVCFVSIAGIVVGYVENELLWLKSVCQEIREKKRSGAPWVSLYLALYGVVLMRAVYFSLQSER